MILILLCRTHEKYFNNIKSDVNKCQKKFNQSNDSR